MGRLSREIQGIRPHPDLDRQPRMAFRLAEVDAVGDFHILVCLEPDRRVAIALDRAGLAIGGVTVVFAVVAVPRRVDGGRRGRLPQPPVGDRTIRQHGLFVSDSRPFWDCPGIVRGPGDGRSHRVDTDDGGQLEGFSTSQVGHDGPPRSPGRGLHAGARLGQNRPPGSA